MLIMWKYGLDVGYAVHRAGRFFPFMDQHFNQIDLTLGFDGRALFDWFIAHPVASNLIRVIYDIAPYQMMLALTLFGFRGLYGRLLQLSTANFIALFLVHIVALYLPALGTYSLYGLTPADHPNLLFTTRAEHVASLLKVREVAPPDLNSFQLFGIVTFPSYHAVMVMEFCWAFFAIPKWRWAALAFNAVVLAGTPVHGSHYLCDIVAGLSIAALSIWLAGQAPKWLVALYLRWKSRAVGHAYHRPGQFPLSG